MQWSYRLGTPFIEAVDDLYVIILALADAVSQILIIVKIAFRNSRAACV